MIENKESWIIEKTEQEEQSEKLLEEEYDKEKELFENTAKRILTQSDDIPDEIRRKIEKVVNEHNLEASATQTFSELYKIYWDNIDLTRAIGNQLISENNMGDYFEFIWKNSGEIINLIKNDNMVVMWTLSSNKLNNENKNWEIINEKESFIAPIYAIPSTLDKNDYEINEISFFDTLNETNGENPNEHLLYSIVSKADEKTTSLVTWIAKTKIENTVTWKEINSWIEFKHLSKTESNYIICNLRIEPALDKKWKQEKWSNWEPLYKITFNLYKPKQNDKK